jgi:hypothetical protein
MPAVAAKKLKLFHATVNVTRAEEWRMEAETPEEARRLLTSGAGHRCHLGDPVHMDVNIILDE